MGLKNGIAIIALSWKYGPMKLWNFAILSLVT